MSNVAALPFPKASRKRAAAPASRSPSFRRRITRQRLASYGVGGVALVLTGLSLSHLAGGVQLLTSGDAPHSWAMAVGVDLGFIALELGQLSITTETLRRSVARFAGPAVKGTLIVSALMNAYAFAAPAPSWPFMVAASLLGISIPALIYVLTRVSVSMWIDCHR